MTTENKRDLAADLAICEAATAGPVHYMRSIHSEYHYEVCNRNFLDTVIATTISEADARMFAEAFEGWPEAIRRAMAAEKAAQEFAEIINDKQAEVIRLRKDKLRLHDVYSAQYARATEYWGEAERLRKENQRLRSVLERMDDRKHAMMPRSQMARLAKEALDYTEGADAGV